jgi:hypothetical protein
VSEEHFLAVVEGVDNDGSRVSELDLEDRVLVLAPPFLTAGCVVLAEF